MPKSKNSVANLLSYCSIVSPKIFSMIVIPSHEVHFDDSVNKTSPSVNFLFLSISHFLHFSTVYAVVTFFLEKIIEAPQQYCPHQLSTQIDLLWYFLESFHKFVNEQGQLDQQFLLSSK